MAMPPRRRRAASWSSAPRALSAARWWRDWRASAHPDAGAQPRRCRPAAAGRGGEAGWAAASDRQRGGRVGAGSRQDHAHAGRQSAHGAGHGRGAGQSARRPRRQHQLGCHLCRRPAAADRRLACGADQPAWRHASGARVGIPSRGAGAAGASAADPHLWRSDPHNGYGPNRFRRLAAEGQDIVLFGEGEERRDHVYIDDVAEIIVRVLQHRSVGALNIATGEVHSFRQVAEQAAALSGKHSAIKGFAALGPHAARRLPPVRYRRLPPGLPGLRIYALVARA